MMLPHQSYKPKDFDAEVIRLKSFEWIRNNGSHIVYRDTVGNYYDIDFYDRSVTVN